MHAGASPKWRSGLWTRPHLRRSRTQSDRRQHIRLFVYLPVFSLSEYISSARNYEDLASGNKRINWIPELADSPTGVILVTAEILLEANSNTYTYRRFHMWRSSLRRRRISEVWTFKFTPEWVLTIRHKVSVSYSATHADVSTSQKSCRVTREDFSMRIEEKERILHFPQACRVTVNVTRNSIHQPGRAMLIYALTIVNPYIASTSGSAYYLRSSFGGHHVLEGLYPAQLFSRLVQCTFTQVYRSMAMFLILCVHARIRPT